MADTDRELLELAAKAAGIDGNYASLDEFPDWMTAHEKVHAHAAAQSAADNAALRAEAEQLRQYLDAAQRRASALGDEVAGLREALERVHNDKSFDCLKIEKTQQYVIAALAARKGTT